MMVRFSDLLEFQKCLKFDDTCYVFEFEIPNTVHVRSALAANASEYGVGGYERRISTDSVKCKAVTTLNNKETFSTNKNFLSDLRTYGTNNLVYHAEPRYSTDVQDINVAFSKRFVPECMVFPATWLLIFL
jgi:hypothetical protein